MSSVTLSVQIKLLKDCHYCGNRWSLGVLLFLVLRLSDEINTQGNGCCSRAYSHFNMKIAYILVRDVGITEAEKRFYWWLMGTEKYLVCIPSCYR